MLRTTVFPGHNVVRGGVVTKRYVPREVVVTRSQPYGGLMRRGANWRPVRPEGTLAMPLPKVPGARVAVARRRNGGLEVLEWTPREVFPPMFR